MSKEEKCDFSIEELKAQNLNSTVERINLGSIIDKLEYLDFNPPYQRGKVWRKNYQTELFRSIFDKTPIGAIHFVLKSDENEDVKYVLDAKQRLLTIKAFKDGELILRIKDENDKLCHVKWKDVINPNSKWHFLHTKILSFQLDIVTWRHRGFSEQKIIFSRVNNSVSLNAWERMYVDYFTVKKLFTYLFDNCFIDKRNFNKSVAEDYRHNGLKLIHMVLATCFGYSLDDRHATRHLASRCLEDSCEKIESNIIEKGLDSSSDINEQTIEMLNLKTQVDQLKKACKWFNLAITHKNSLMKDKKFESNFVLDVISFFVKKMQDKILTTPYVEQNLDKIANFVKTYLDVKQAKGDKLKKRSTDAGSIKCRVDEMERVFLQCDLDNEMKNKSIKQAERTKAALDAKNFCPITGLELSDDNVQFDHVNPKSTHGETLITAISDVGNNRKSDQTHETVVKTKDYMDFVFAST